MSLRCRLGWHRWTYLVGLRRVCLRCWCKQVFTTQTQEWVTEVNA